MWIRVLFSNQWLKRPWITAASHGFLLNNRSGLRSPDCPKIDTWFLFTGFDLNRQLVYLEYHMAFNWSTSI